MRKIKALFTITLYCSLLLSLISCNDNDPTISGNDELANSIQSITYYTENYPPFNYEEHGSIFGLSVDILDELFSTMNVNLNRQNVDLDLWSTAYNLTLTTENTMLFSMLRNTERENLFKWVGPIAPQKEVIISLSSSGVVINTSDDLHNYKIGVIEDYGNIQLLLDYGINIGDLNQVKTVNQLYTQLQNGTVDCIAYSEISHNLIIGGLGLVESDFEISYVMKVNELYYAFNITTSDDIINHFQNALDELKNDKTIDGSSKYEKIISNYNIINYSDDGITNEQVINLVNRTSNDIIADAPGTFTKMNNYEHPYRDEVYPALYSFAYDTSLTIVAHASNIMLVGNNFKGKTDVSGKPFRDEILSGALENGSGWEDYIYTKPGEGGLYYKTTYYKLTEGSDGKLYIVCAGKYK
ncbi:MAG: transporter substrate-binding domain-containing protein [Melioribacteraceae bacterium]|nr:transporter substrate-binding domain-containing protein [Melioribacteraceae bacterium]MCF8394674.1 transporter substrate-binding domain-containing protein [Melioribacteraceae bacterium]MCF8417992.1 transporter substrate-binding domain-containing protein [Melioribacteraceae bacterium]